MNSLISDTFPDLTSGNRAAVFTHDSFRMASDLGDPSKTDKLREAQGLLRDRLLAGPEPHAVPPPINGSLSCDQWFLLLRFDVQLCLMQEPWRVSEEGRCGRMRGPSQKHFHPAAISSA